MQTSNSGYVWAPTPEIVERANVTRLARRLAADGYHELHRISVEDPERFWPAVVDDLGIEFSEPWDAVVDDSRGPEWATWFAGGRVNVARVLPPPAGPATRRRSSGCTRTARASR